MKPLLSGGKSAKEVRDLQRTYRQQHPPAPDKSTRGLGWIVFFLCCGTMLLIRGCQWLLQ